MKVIKVSSKGVTVYLNNTLSTVEENRDVIAHYLSVCFFKSGTIKPDQINIAECDVICGTVYLQTIEAIKAGFADIYEG